MIKERYCSYEVAKLLKEKGFRECCRYCYGTAIRHNGEDIDEDEEFELKSEGRADEIEYIKGGILHNLYYDNGKSFGKDVCATPTHQMACDYVFETYGLWICPNLLTVINKDENGFKTEKVVWTYDVISATTGKFFYEDYEDGGRKEYASQYEATEAGIKYSLENLV